MSPSSGSPTSIRRGSPSSPSKLGAEGAAVSTDLDAMLAAARPHTLVVCTRDDTHADIIVDALERGIDVVTEKPMATTAEDVRRILDAERRTGRRVDVAFNYRFAPTSRKIRELLAAGRIGTVTSADFHWYLDTVHGADYFRRWHAYAGTPAACSCTRRPIISTCSTGGSTRTRCGCSRRGRCASTGRRDRTGGPGARAARTPGTCEFYLDMGADPWLDSLYEAPSAEDGYLRDACVYRADIDIWDTMSATLLYANGVQVSYSLNAYMPIEGYHLAFNGTHGRIEVRMYEKQAFEAPVGRDEILVLGTDRSVERIAVDHGPGGHFGGDPLLHRSLFEPEGDDPMRQRAGARAGALSVLTGVAAARSAETGVPVEFCPCSRQADGRRDSSVWRDGALRGWPGHRISTWKR